MERTKHVEVTSSQEKQAIINTSVQALATRVVGQAAEMKKRFVAPITNEEGRPSALGVLDRVVRQTEEALDEITLGVQKLGKATYDPETEELTILGLNITEIEKK